LGVARKKTKPGLDGAGGRYEPTTTSRAWAGSGARDTDSSAPSAAPSTSSLRWLATATRGAGRDGTAFSADGAAACGGAAQQRELVGAGGRSEAKSGEEEDTEEAMGGRKNGLARGTASRLARAGATTPYPDQTSARDIFSLCSVRVTASVSVEWRAYARLGSVLSSCQPPADKI